jgi:peroxiredoxin
MKRLLMGCLLSSVVALPVWAAIEEGQAAPAFKTQASLAGKPFTYDLKSALKKGPVVVYFYPSAYTGGCNIQAHDFAQKLDQFADAGATVVGVSLDNIERLNDFSADPQYCAGKLAVASDVDGKIAKSYGLEIREAVTGKKDTRGIDINHATTERTTFIVTPDGKVAAKIGGLKPAENVEKALAAVQDSQKSRVRNNFSRRCIGSMQIANRFSCVNSVRR